MDAVHLPEQPTAAAGGPAQGGAGGRRLLIRVIAALLALLSLTGTLLMPAGMLYLSIGSLGCVGPGCNAATAVAWIAGAVAFIAGLTATVMCILIAVRPQRWRVIGAAIALIVFALAIAGQIGNLSNLRSGQAAYDAALQTAFGVDSAMQEILFAATGLTIWGDDGLTGPFLDAVSCELADGGSGYQASAAITISDRLQPGEADRTGLTRYFDSSRERLLTLDAQLPVTHEWTRTDSGWRWTITTACRSLPQPNAAG